MWFPPVLCRRYLSTRLFLSFLSFSLPSSLSLFVSSSSCSSVPQHTWGPAGDVSAWIMQESLRSCTCSPFLPSLSLSLCQCILSISRSPCPHFSSKTIIPLRRSGMWFPVYLFFCKKKDVCSLKTKAGLHSVHSLSLSLAVDFVDCGRGSGLRFESGDPADFRIEADGMVFAARTLQLSDRKGRSLEIKAKDVKSQEEWLVHVNFTQPKQVGSHALSHVNSERRLHDCEFALIITVSDR